MDTGMLLLSCIPAVAFIGAAVILEIIFDLLYDHSQKFREWADRKIYQVKECEGAK